MREILAIHLSALLFDPDMGEPSSKNYEVAVK